MGCTSSILLGYQELRCSIPGSLVNEKDFNMFHSMCKVESAGTMSNILHPSSTQLFYVVLSGEIVVYLSSPDIKNTEVTTFGSGETIHFFNAKMNNNLKSKLDFSHANYLINGNIKLSLHFKSLHNETAKVIGMDRKGLDEFTLKAHENIFQITSFVNMNIVELFKISESFQNITEQQACMFGPLLKIRLAQQGDEVRPDIPQDQINNSSKQGNLIMLLHGSIQANSIHYAASSEHVCRPVRSSVCWSSKGFGHSTLFHEPTFSAIPNLHRSFGSEAGSCLSRGTSFQAEAPATIPRGSIIGSEQYFVCNSDVRSRSYLTTAPSVLGYLPMAALDALFEVDARFKRVYSRNMFLQIIHWVRPHVALLSDMDDWSLTLLACKLRLCAYSAGETILQSGDPSECAYIILGGSVKELITTQISSTADSICAVQHPTQTGERQLKWSAMFNIEALASNQPCFYTAVASEPTLLLCLSKSVLDQVYYNNKAKLCEVRIRLLGAEVDLQHTIDHPTGSALFQQFLAQQLAAENLTFYKAVDRYDSLCRSIVKQCTQIQELHDRLQTHSSALYDGRSKPTEIFTGPSQLPGVHVTRTSTDTESCSCLPGLHSGRTGHSEPQLAHARSASPETSFSLRVATALAEGGESSKDAFSAARESLNLASLSSKALCSPQHRTVHQQDECVGDDTTDNTERTSPNSTDSDYSSIDISTTSMMPQKASCQEQADIHSTPCMDSQGKQARRQGVSSMDSAAMLSSTLHHTAAVGSAAENAYQQNCYSMSVAGTEQSYNQERFQRLTGKIKQKLQYLYKCIEGLQRVALAIMDSYICIGTEQQVNLPFILRAQCETSFKTWCAGTIDESAVLDLSFVDLFREAKGEVLKLLRDDLFPRWKTTPEFHSFIANYG